MSFNPRDPDRRRTGVTADRLRDLLDYDAVNGVFIRKKRPESDFKSASVADGWNRRFAGKVAGSIKAGRRQVRIDYDMYLNYRLVWLWHNGEWPDCVDHINGDPLDDRIENLRSVTHAENCRNARLRSDSTTGAVGVSRNGTGRYVAQLHRGGRHIHLGCFDTLEEAIAARKAANGAHGFHENHGRRA